MEQQKLEIAQRRRQNEIKQSIANMSDERESASTIELLKGGRYPNINHRWSSQASFFGGHQKSNDSG